MVILTVDSKKIIDVYWLYFFISFIYIWGGVTATSLIYRLKHQVDNIK
jgi:hypothetical protein